MAVTRVKIAGSFAVVSDKDVSEILKKFEIIQDIVEFSHHRLKIAASQTNVAVNFGTVSPAKKVYISPSSRVTLKVNSSGETGFPIDGLTILSGDITALFVTTETTEVTIDVVIVQV